MCHLGVNNMLIKSIVVIMLGATMLINSTFVNANQITKSALKNNVPVFVKETPGTGVVAIQIWIKCGSLYENGKYGLAHAVEHMIFNGTKDRPSQRLISRPIEDVGGSINAYTSYDMTSFQVVIPSKSYMIGLETLSDIIKNPLFDQSSWERERKVVRSELVMGEDDPKTKFDIKLLEVAFSNTPYSGRIAGNVESVNEITIDDFRNFHDFYNQKNIAIVAVGDVSRGEILAASESLFGDLKNGENTNGFHVAEIGLGQKTRFFKMDTPSKISQMSLFYRTVPFSDSDTAAIDVLSTILGEGRVSRLFKRLVGKDKKASAVSSQIISFRKSGGIHINAVLNNQEIVDVSKSILEEITKLTYEYVSETELSLAKDSIMANYGYKNEDAGSQAVFIGHTYILDEGASIEEYFKKINSVTESDLMRVAKRYFVARNLVFGLLPGTKTDFTGKSLDDILSQVKQNTNQASSVPAPVINNGEKMTTLKNGITLIINENHSNPTVAASIAIHGGVPNETKENNGITAIISGALLKGSRTMPAEVISDRISYLSAQINTKHGRDTISINGQFVEKNIFGVLLLMRDILCYPNFSKDEIEGVKNNLLAALKKESENPIQLGSKYLRRTVYAHTPYELPANGDSDSISNIDAKAIMEFYSRLLHDSPISIVISGDVNTQEVTQFASDLFESIGRDEIIHENVFPQSLTPGNIVNIPLDKKQTVVFLGCQAPAFSSPDRYAMEIIFHLFNGMNGRLFNTIRSKHSLAYQTFALANFDYSGGLIGFIAFVDPENQDKARKLMINEFDSIINNSISLTELNSAKLSIIGRYKISNQTNEQRVQEIARNQLLGGDSDRDYCNNIQAVTIEDIERVANKYLSHDRVHQIIVGPEK